MTPDTPTATLGASIGWTVTATNVASYALVDVSGEFRMLYPGWQGPIRRSPMGVPTSPDGDDVLAPGETWQWRISTRVPQDGSFLEVLYSVRRPGIEPIGPIGAFVTSDPLVAIAPTTTAPATTAPATTAPSTTAAPTSVSPSTTTSTTVPAGLPPTGSNSNLGMLALGLLVVGGLLLAVGRPRQA